MSQIARVQVHEFTYQADNIGVDPGGFDLVQMPGSSRTLSKFGIVIETRDGSRGEYVGMWGGTPMSLSQVLYLLPHLIGRDALQREFIYDEFKRALRQYDHMGYGYIDIALWDLFGKRVGLPIWAILGGWRKRLPTYASTTHGDRHGALSSAEDYAAFAEHCYELGYRAFKMHGWYDGNLAEEIAAVRLLGKRVGGRMALRSVTACQIRTFSDALTLGLAGDARPGFVGSRGPVQRHGRFRVRPQPAEASDPNAAAHDRARARGRTQGRFCPRRRHGPFARGPGIRFGNHRGAQDRASRRVARHRRRASRLRSGASARDGDVAQFQLLRARAGRSEGAHPLPPVYACDYSDDLEAIGSDDCLPVPEGPGLGVAYDWDFIARNRTKLHEFE